jgi:large subunit ribosomal protein L25
MSTAKLDAEPRNLQAGKPKQLRRTGMVPVIVYGKTQAPVLLQVAERPLDTTLRHSGSQLIEVNVAGGGKHNILVREVQRDPVTHRVLHADFYAVAMNEKQRVSVSITGVGKPATMASGLMVLQNHETINIEALPADIPAGIEVDLTDLDVDKPVKVSDLPAVKGVAYLDDPDEFIFALVATQAGIEEEEEEAAEEESAEPEVVRRGREEEEEE